MPLHVIAGPPNSGRAGAIRAAFADAVVRGPVLAVPTRDDVVRFEREMCEAGGAAIGGSILTFRGLFEEVASMTGAEPAPVLTPAQRARAVALAVGRAQPRALAASAAAAGFPEAAEGTIAELQSAAIDPPTLRERAGGASHLVELAAIYAAYLDIRDAAGRTDEHAIAARAVAALRAAPDAWGGRPVFLYGFDDLTPAQHSLLAALAAAAPVTVAVTHEDRAALAARARLLASLQELGAQVERLEAQPAFTASQLLHRIEREFLREDPEPLAADGSVRFLEAAGDRAEVEQVAAGVARLVAGGTDPSAIAIVERSLEARAGLWEDVLAAYGVPHSVHGTTRFADTAPGRGLLAALRIAAGSGTAADAVALVRTPGRARPAAADRLERAALRGRLASPEAAFSELGWEPDEVAWLREAGSGSALLAAARRALTGLAERSSARLAEVGDAPRRLELRAAAAAVAAMTELEEVPTLAPQAPAELIAMLERLPVPLAPGAGDAALGTVRVLTPYGARVSRVRHLFVASLQEGVFPRPWAADPLLSEDERALVGLPARADPDDEERYLFGVLLSRPTHGLHLSYRTADEDGQALPRSVFVDDVRRLLRPPPTAAGEPDPLVAEHGGRRELADVTFEPRSAPSARELARALAARSADPARAMAGMDLPEPLRSGLAAELAEAGSRTVLEPGPLAQPEVLEELGGRDLFGASTLEEYLLCSYRWFVGHELEPQTLEPESGPMAQGSVVHTVLERLYRDPPDGGNPGRPTPESAPSWQSAARELLAAEVGSRALAPVDAASRAVYRRLEVHLTRFLAIDAELPADLRPALIEASFGEREDADRPPLDLGGLRLHGKIDRVDVRDAAAGTVALLRDYKSGASVAKLADLEPKRKLQLQLYLRALEELWQLPVGAALYQPLAGRDVRARGMARGSATEAALAGAVPVNADVCEDERFDGLVESAVTLARQAATGMRAGSIDRNPLDGRCPRWCEFQSICRRERAAPGAHDEGE